MAKNKKSDEKLCSAAIKDAEAFEELLQRYEAKLLRYVQRFTGLNRECAEDVLQEAFIKIYKNLNDFDQSMKFSSWAYRITHNEAISYLRKNDKHRKNLAIESDEEGEASLLDILKSDTDVGGEVAQKEENAHVRAVLMQLPDDYKDVLVLRFLEEMDYSEISNVLKKPVGTVSVLIKRAKEKFKNLALRNNLDLN